MAIAVLSGKLTKTQAARAYAVCAKIVSRWVKRFEQVEVLRWPIARRVPN